MKFTSIVAKSIPSATKNGLKMGSDGIEIVPMTVSISLLENGLLVEFTTSI